MLGINSTALTTFTGLSLSMALLTACGSPISRRSTESTEPTAQPPAAPTNPGFQTGGAGPSGSDSCPTESKWPYFLSEEADIYRFEPDAKVLANSKLFKLGAPTCPGRGSSSRPYSMTIDEHRNAYILYTIPSNSYLPVHSEARLYKVDLATLACVATPWTASKDFYQFTVASVASAPGAPDHIDYLTGTNMGAIAE